MSKQTALEKALTHLLIQLQQSARLHSGFIPQRFFPKTQYIRSDWDNPNTTRLNKDTFIDRKYSRCIAGLWVYRGYVAEVVGREPATGERIYFINFSGFYYYDCGQYKRL
jgi:hypothetical protein